MHKASIQEHGLSNRDGPIYLTTHPLVALMEALRTVNGEENLRDGYKKGVGGSPIIIRVEDQLPPSCVWTSLDIMSHLMEPDIDRPRFGSPLLPTNASCPRQSPSSKLTRKTNVKSY